MAEQAEAGDVRGGVYFESQGHLAGGTVERAHGGDGGLDRDLLARPFLMACR